MTTVSAVADIEIGPRHRHDLGDIAALAASIDELGLLHPIVVTRNNVLVAGERRLAACRSLGWDEVSVTIAHNLADAADLLKAERDENTCRKPMTPTEEHSIYSALLELEAAEARQRMSDGGKGVKLSHPSPVPVRAKSRAAEAATGSAGRARTLDKVGETIAVAESPDTPEPVREVAKQALKEMDATGRVDGAYRRTKEAEAKQLVSSITDAIDRRDPSAKSDRERATLKAAYSRGMKGVADLPVLDAEAVASVLTDSETNVMAGVIRSLSKWAERVVSVRRRAGLTLIEGEAK